AGSLAGRRGSRPVDRGRARRLRKDVQIVLFARRPVRCRKCNTWRSWDRLTGDDSLGIGLPRLVLPLRGDLPGVWREDRPLGLDQWQVVGQWLEEEVLVADRHRR